MAPCCRHLGCRTPAKTAGKGRGKRPAKKKNKRGTRSKAATQRRINKAQAHRLASALDRAEEEEAGTPDTQESAEATGRRVVVTQLKRRSRRRRRRLLPLSPRKGRSFARGGEGGATTLEWSSSPSQPIGLFGCNQCDLARSLRAATEQWQQANFRQRVEIKQELRSKLPRGSLATSFLQRAGLDEACSSCDNRRKASAITAKARAIRCFSAGKLRRRVSELTRPKPVAKEAIEDEEEEEEESSQKPPLDPGHLRRRPFDPSSSSDFEDERRRSASRGADAPAAVAAAWQQGPFSNCSRR